MELTFDHKDIKHVFEIMNITIQDVYFSAETNAVGHISVYMYWISPAYLFNYYQEDPGISSLYLQIKGKWFNHEDQVDPATFIGSEMIDWIKTQKYINCRYFVDGTGTGTIGSHSVEYPCS